MKKFLLSLLIGCSLQAEEQAVDIKRVSEDIGVVKITVTLYKNKNDHNAQAWQDVVIQRTFDCMKQFEENGMEGIDGLCRFAKELQGLKDLKEDARGIHGEITISVGDGRCPDGCCSHDGEAKECACIDRYAGMCPCSADINNRGCGKPSCRQQEVQQKEEAALEDKCTTCGKPPKPVKDAETQDAQTPAEENSNK